MQGNPMTLKVRTEAGVFGADRMRPINLNLRYLAVKETLLAEIRSGFFLLFVLFCFVFPVSLHFSSSHHTVCLTVWRCAAISSFFKLMKKTLEREHLLTAHPKVCGRRKKRVTQNISLKFQMRLMWKILMHAQFPHKYTQCFLISCV